MARRKRASMREGPLADLFRSTASREPDEQAESPESPESARESEREETRELGGREAAAPPPAHEERISEPEPPPDPERVRAYRVEEHELPPIREPRERPNRTCADD